MSITVIILQISIKGREKTDINSRSGLIVILIVVVIGAAYITLASQVNHNQTSSNTSNITPARDNANGPGNTNTSINNGTSSPNDIHTNSTTSTKTTNQTQNTTVNSTKKVSAQAFTTSNTS
ncbi:hypothetical protein [Methanobacterium sp. MBAC-LM]|uniref:hypothetical protein n=1 Tax=Methanobacterium sp. MBAC-LM TaxID=3412034 RepID=UPI003C76F11E